MKCPVCNQPMKKVSWHISYNPREDNKEYDNTMYQCELDDVWLNVEIPKKGAHASRVLIKGH